MKELSIVKMANALILNRMAKDVGIVVNNTAFIVGHTIGNILNNHYKVFIETVN